MSEVIEEIRGYLDDDSYWIQRVEYGRSGRITDIVAVLRRAPNKRLGGPDVVEVRLKDEGDYAFALDRAQER
jgi:hypothetical protein